MKASYSFAGSAIAIHQLKPPVSHNDNHTEPRNPSQEEQPRYEVPTHNIYNTLENNTLEVREKNE